MRKQKPAELVDLVRLMNKDNLILAAAMLYTAPSAIRESLRRGARRRETTDTPLHFLANSWETGTAKCRRSQRWIATEN